MATSTTSTPLVIDSIEWEVTNDKGFVYKRQKRRLDPTSLARAQAQSQSQDQDPEPGPAILLKQRRKKKRQYLLNLKEKYLTELSQWDNLSNTLNAMQNAANQHVDNSNSGDKRELGNNNQGFQSVAAQVHNSSASLVDQLRMQVEAQEAVIHNFEQLCDATDSLCNAYEETVNQQFFDLPTWVNSPQEVMASLCDD